MDGAVTVATLEFTADPARVLTEMARITRPGGRMVAAVLNPARLWGILDQPARRAPYASGCFLPRVDLLALGLHEVAEKEAEAMSDPPWDQPAHS